MKIPTSKQVIPLLTLMVITLVAVFAGFAREPWIANPTLVNIALILTLAVMVYYVIFAKNKVVPILVSVIAIVAGFLFMKAMNPFMPSMQQLLRIMKMKMPLYAIMPTRFMWNFVFAAAVILFVALLVTMIVDTKNQVRKIRTNRFAMMALPQYQKFLKEFTEAGGVADEETQAKLFAKAMQYITLKAPATAVFADMAEIVAIKTEKGYRVSGYVDSQNSYGALIRTPFNYLVFKNGEEWSTNTTIGAQTGGKIASRFLVYWIIGIVFTLLSTAFFYFVMFGF